MDAKSVNWKDRTLEAMNLLVITESSVQTDACVVMPSFENDAVPMMPDSSGFVCPNDIITYADLNSCVALISSGLNIDDPQHVLQSLSWQMTGATEASSGGSGINQIGSYTFNQGTTVITYRGATLYNNSINCTFTVTVSDNQAPRLISSPGHITVRSLSGECYATVSWTEPSATDNCVAPDQLIYSSNYNSGQQFPVGSTLVEYQISDGTNTAVDNFTVTVMDTEAPELIAPPVLESECGKPIPDAFTTWAQFEQAGGSVNDNCSVNYGSFRYVGQTSSGITCPYTVTRTYSILDSDGNVSEVKHVIQVTGEGMAYEAKAESTEPEVLLEPGAETQAEILFSKTDVSCKGSRTGAVDLTVNGASGTLSYVWSTQNGSGIVQGAEDQSSLSDGDYTVMVYEDGVRLLAFDFSILVSDNQAPEINAPENIQRTCGQSIPVAYSTWSEFANAGGTVSDNCQIYYSSFRLASETQSNPSCPYTITRIYEITDVNGNRGFAEHLITVEEAEVVLKSGMAGTITAVADGGWNVASTWDCNCIPAFDDDVVIPSSFIVTVDAAAVANTITIESGGTLNGGASTLQVYGNWTNNGTFTAGTGTVEFAGSTDAMISGSSATAFNNFILDKGADVLTNLVVQSDITISDLTFTNGVLDIESGTTDIVNIVNPDNTIPSTSGLRVSGGTLTTGYYSIINEGLIEVTSGVATFGTGSGNSIYTQVDGAFIVSGGTVDIAGRLENTAGGTLSGYPSGININGGIITLATAGNNESGTGSLNVTTNGAFNFTGGTIIFENPSTAGTALDLGLVDGTGTGAKTITNGIFQFGNGNTPIGSTFRIDSQIKIPNIVTYSGSALFLDMPVDGASSVECIDQAIAPTPPEVTDNCGDVVTPTGPVINESFNGCAGTKTYTYTYEDCDGSTHDWIYTYTIDDVTNPTASSPSGVDLECAADLPTAETTIAGFLTLSGAAAADNCTATANLTVTSNDVVITAGSCSGVITRTYTIEDECGNTISVDHVFTVTDNENPTASAPTSVDLECAADLPTAETTIAGFLTLPGAAAADNCTAAANLTVTSNDVVSTSGNCSGVITRTYTIEDECGNAFSVDYVFTVTDNENPTASAPTSVDLECADDLPTAETTISGFLTLAGAAAADNCTSTANLMVTSNDVVSTSGSCSGVITRTYTIEDECGNAFSVDHVFTVTDNEDPTASNPLPIIVECTADVPAPDITVVTDEADNCTGAPVVAFVSDVSDGNTCPEVIIRTYSVTDDCGNSIQVMQTITIDDTTAPVAPSLTSVTEQCEWNPTPPIATDNCSGAVTGTPSVSFPYTTTGTTTVTWTFTDDCGNTSTSNQVVTIIDNTSPTWDYFPPNVSYIEYGGDTTVATNGIATATDNCVTPTVTYRDSLKQGNCQGNYTIYRIWTANDTSSYSSPTRRIQTLSVLDTSDPILNCSSFTVASPDDIPISDEFVGIDATDNSGVVDTILVLSEEYFGLGNGAGFCPDSVVRVYEAYDECGNTTQCTQTIRVSDVSTCEVCQDEVPFEFADLSGAPDSLWFSEEKRREGICCSVTQDPGEGPPRCVSFNVYLDENAVGIIFDIYSGAEPPGALFYQIDCGPEIPVGEVVCLSGGRTHTVTFCKPGSNKNIYSIQSIQGAVTTEDVIARSDETCTDTISVSGLESATAIWSVVSPNDQTLLRYLDLTDPVSAIFNPDSLAPANIIYEVCGVLLGTNVCEDGNPIEDCATVVANALPEIEVGVDRTLTALCDGDLPVINAEITPAIYNYTYEWYDGPDGTGSIISTSPSWQPPSTGTYSLVVTEYESGVGCNSSLQNFIIAYDTIGPSVLSPPDTLFLECNDPDRETLIQQWLATASGTEGDGSSATVDNDYSPFVNYCDEIVPVVFSSQDTCGNMSKDTAYIKIEDTTAPVISTDAVSMEFDCSTVNQDDHPDYVLWLDNQGYAGATDDCDPSLTWTADTASVNWIGNGARDSITVTFTVTDDCGNSDQTTATFTIVDDQPPTINCPASVETTIAQDSCSSDTFAIGLVTATDVCSEPELEWTLSGATTGSGTGQVNGQRFNVGVTTVRYIAIDAAGLTDTCWFSVWVKHPDVPLANIVCPPDSVWQAANPVSCDAYVELDTLVWTDPCNEIDSVWNNSAYGTPSDASGTYPVGEYEFKWFVRDVSGSIDSTCTVKVVVADVDPPVFTSCPDTIEGIINLADCEVTNFPLEVPEWNEYCEVDTLWYITPVTSATTPASGTGYVPSDYPFSTGQTRITYVLLDQGGNTDTCSFIIWPKHADFGSFTKTCPTDSVWEAADPVSCDAYIALDTVVWDDPCKELDSIWNNSIYATSPSDATGTYPIGEHEFKWFVRDVSGSLDSCMVKVVVADVDPPVFTSCPDTIEGIINLADCEVTNFPLQVPVWNEYCQVDTLWSITPVTSATAPASGTGYVPSDYPFSPGQTRITYVLLDQGGNTDTCSFIIWPKHADFGSFTRTCPSASVIETVNPDSCERYIPLDTVAWVDPCKELDSIWNNSEYSTSPSDASGTYPIGTTTFKWYIKDVSGSIDSSCVVSVTVNDLPPELVVPNDTVVQADFDKPYVSDIVVKLPYFYDNCDSTLTWRMWGATNYTVGDTLAPDIYVVHSPDTFNLGVTYIEYTFEDGHGNRLVDTFTITVLGAPEIDCPSDTIIYLDPVENDCDATFDPGVPELIEGVPPIDWEFTIVYADGRPDSTGSYTSPAPGDANPMGEIDFPLGVTTIYWRAQNVSGYDTCSHWVEVIDTIAPTMDADPYEDCVDMIEYAIYNPSNPDPYYHQIDPNLEKAPSPDYSTFYAGDTYLDLTSLEDNCCDSLSMVNSLSWTITFQNSINPIDGTTIVNPPISGTGQPSTYGANIKLWGDGVDYTAVTHTITYQVTDCNGNVSEEIVRAITITPRPHIIKQN
nr:HYR domain-containing protein [uncultured Draconibacterium sp.]